MKAYEKRKKLLTDRAVEVKIATDDIDRKYDHKLKEFNEVITMDDIKELGFVKVGFYGAGNEYVMEKNGKRICVGAGENMWVLLRGEARGNYNFYNREELKDYADGIILNDYKFYCYC